MMVVISYRAIRDHPRLRGEHMQSEDRLKDIRGSPPLTRGTRYSLISYNTSVGITPAYAGNTNTRRRGCTGSWDHPRLRGEHARQALSMFKILGSPPLTRGTLANNPEMVSAWRITPAYAGNTKLEEVRRKVIQDHPRLRGEHFFLQTLFRGLAGSPPLTRGTQ